MSGKKKLLRETEEELEAQRESERREKLGIGRFSGQPSVLSQSLASRQFHELTPARMERRAEMNKPYQSHIAEPVQSGISSTLLHSRLDREALEKQARFFNLLESEYGAIKGNDESYEDAINRYLDEEAMHLANQQKQRSEYFKAVKEKLKKEREGFYPFQKIYNAYNALFQRNYKSQSESRREQEEQERQQRYEEEHRRRQQQWEDMQRAQREWEQYQRQQQQHSYARGGPAQEPPPPSGKRPKMPRNKALAFMGIDPQTAPTDRDIKKAFNRRSLQLHPDKNLDNREKAAIKFKRMRKAYNSLINKGQSDSDTSGSMGGSTLRRNRKSHRKTKKTPKKTHGKTPKKSPKKTHGKTRKNTKK